MLVSTVGQAFTKRLWHPASVVLTALPILFALHHLLKQPCRSSKVPRTQERVLVLGASSGIGRTIAHLYAARGARVCVVARRQAQLDQVVEECRREAGLPDGDTLSRKVLSVVADYANVGDMVRVRAAVESGTLHCSLYESELTISFR
jgi:NADPH:quinone reductase-like Zn-dependent oxidoreductase